MLLLFLVHLVTKRASTTPVALPLAPRTSTDICDDINNCRKLFDIVWGSHPNVPPPNQSWLVLFRHRLKMMLTGIVAPEIMVGLAARQFWGARILSKKYNFTRTHGFFFCMGGFVSSAGYPITTEEQLADPDLGPEFLKGIQNVDEEDIKDKSKGDALSKGVCTCARLWFTTQCLARVHQHLAVTELEVATLAFAVVNIFIWLLWWNKPLDVQRPVVVGPPKLPDTQPINPRQLSRWDRFFYAFWGRSADYDYDPLSSTSVPSFWSSPMEINPLRGTVGIAALAGCMFGAIQCAAWKNDFPTTAEMWIWRAGSLVTTTSPAVVFLTLLVDYIIYGTTFEETALGDAISAINLIANVVSIPIYMMSRAVLIPLPFVALRSLPPSAFVDVNWSAYIPHI
ncbi:hypothetical protein B0H16DRAFT_1636932 [Mycena metata]|uniref:Uncharacterized protein n=1 Tax=Mycena metata TaxID=1033252 RepID=A0AAD7M7K9_9AGAR|nr:hypothetical protein B0H16DRAFT_1636932 [Mycena metata]